MRLLTDMVKVAILAVAFMVLFAAMGFGWYWGQYAAKLIWLEVFV